MGPAYKINIMRVCGLLMSLIAVCEASCCVWYGVVLAREFYWPNNPDQVMVANVDQVRYEYGACIYIGYIGALFAALSAYLFFKYPGNLQDENEVERIFRGNYHNTMTSSTPRDSRIGSVRKPPSYDESLEKS